MTTEEFTKQIIEVIIHYQHSSMSENEFAELACNLLSEFRETEGDGFA